jgi:hypothetical protein
LDLVRENNLDLHVERSIGHIDLQAFFADRRDVFFIDIHKRNVLPRAREAATDDAADGSRTDDDHAIAHVCLRVRNRRNIETIFERSNGVKCFATIRAFHDRSNGAVVPLLEERGFVD